MDAARLLEWIEKPEQLDASAAAALNEIVESFPYFVGARMLHLKALDNIKSFRYNGQLKKTAAHTPDRSVLFEFITAPPIAPQALEEKQHEQQRQPQEQRQQQPQEQPQEQSQEQSQEQPQLQPEERPQEQEQEQQESVRAERQLEDVLEESDDTAEIENAIREDGDAERVIGRPLKFDRTEQHSFAEWLKLTSMKPIERDEEEHIEETETELPSGNTKWTGKTSEPEHKNIEEQRESLSRQDLIDRFLAESPRMSPPQKNALGKGNAAKPSLEEDDSLMTETLARVYTEQGLFDKAVKAYRLLSLKYPEKSGYFADRINEINDLKERK